MITYSIGLALFYEKVMCISTGPLISHNFRALRRLLSSYSLPKQAGSVGRIVSENSLCEDQFLSICQR
jgi:hypothetical protein